VYLKPGCGRKKEKEKSKGPRDLQKENLMSVLQGERGVDTGEAGGAGRGPRS